MLRLWRNIEDKDPALDAKVRKSLRTNVNIPLPGPGKGAIIRMNALPVTRMPGECQAITFRSEMEWSDLRAATSATEGNLIFTKSDTVLCWGRETLIRDQFKDVVSISTYDISPKIVEIDRNLHIKAFLEEAMCHALARGKPLLTRTTKTGSYPIADAHSSDQSPFVGLQKTVGKTSGQIAGLFAPVDEIHPHPEKVFWAEALRISIDIVDERSWLFLDPSVWIWPPRARRDAATFLDERQAGRYNKTFNELLDAWLAALLGSHGRNAEIKVSAYEGGTVAETPSFGIGSRTAYTRRLAS
jgi:hypothetical protein